MGLVGSLRVPSKQYQRKKDIEKSSQDFNKHPVHTIGYQFEMRDLYNRKSRLKYWIEKIHTDLDDENDKTDVLKFVEIMQEKDQSILTIIKGISVILQLRKQWFTKNYNSLETNWIWIHI